MSTHLTTLKRLLVKATVNWEQEKRDKRVGHATDRKKEVDALSFAINALEQHTGNNP